MFIVFTMYQVYMYVYAHRRRAELVGARAPPLFVPHPEISYHKFFLGRFLV